MIELIKDVALIGTDRKTINIDSLPKDIRYTVEKEKSEEQRLLDAITYLHFYSNHGNSKNKTIENITNPIDEIQSDTPNPANTILEDILKLDYLLKNSLLKEWLNIVDQTDFKIPARYVLDVLNTATSFSVDDRRKIYDNIGKRGKYLLEIYPIPAFKFSDTSNIWSLGRYEERLDYFDKLRKSDVEQALALLNKDWNRLNLKEKKGILAALSDTLSIKDIPFLKSLYHTEFEQKATDKVGVKQLKIMTISLLMRLGYSPIVNQITEQLGKYVSQGSKGLISGILGDKSKKITLPQQTDKYWNGANLNLLYGLEEKNSNMALFDFDPHFWMGALIEAFPFDFWTTLLQKDPLATMTYLLTDPQFRTKIKGEQYSIFRNSLIQNGLNIKDPLFIESLTKLIDGKDVEVLVPLMSQPNFENYILKNRQCSNLKLLSSRGGSEEYLWSLSFTKNCISQILKFCKSGSFRPNMKFGIVMSKYFHPQAYEHLISLSKNFVNEPWFDSWRDNIVIVIQNTLKIRNQLRQFKLSIND